MGDLTEEQQRILNDLRGPQDEAEKSPEEVITAFLVVQHADGQWSAQADWESVSIVQQRQAHFDDFLGGSANVQSSCQIQQTAMHTALMLQQQAAAMQQRMQQQAESNRVASLIDPSKLRSPGA